jgi:hypothetical protein
MSLAARSIRVLALCLPLLALISTTAPGRVEAASLTRGGLVNGGSVVGAITSPEQVDSYTFAGNAGESVILQAVDTSLAGGLSPQILVLRPDGSQIASALGSAVAAVELSARVTTGALPATGTYTVRVRHVTTFGGSGVGTYRLHFAKAPGANEHGALVNGTMHSGTIDLGDVDTYTFSANAGESVVLQAADTGVSGGLSPWIQVFRPDGSHLASNASSSVAAIELSNRVTTGAIPVSGVYTVVVRHVETFGGSGTGDYRLHFTKASGANEHGALTNGGTHAGRIDLGDVDSYTFFAQAGESVVLQVADDGTAGTLSPWVQVFRPDGGHLASSSDSSVAAIELSSRITTGAIPVTGTYTVMVRHVTTFGGTGVGDYQLHFAKAAGANEHGALINGGVRTGAIELGDVDSYTFFANAGESVVLQVAEDEPSGGLSPWVQVFRPDGQFLASNADSSVASIELSSRITTGAIPVTGIYTVMVRHVTTFGGTGTGRYKLHFAKPPGANEHGALTSGATRVGTIDRGDIDTYTFFANAGEHVTLQVADFGTTGGLSPWIQVYRPNGAFLASASGSSSATILLSSSVTTGPIPTSGIYTVVIRHVTTFGGTGEGGYTLNFTLTNLAGIRLSYAALGDSYPSGEGLLPYYDPTDNPISGCHRSTRAYPTLVRLPSTAAPVAQMQGADFDLLACTGATTSNVRPDGDWQNENQPPQMAPGNGVNNSRDLVTLTVGANDAGFARVFVFCLLFPDCQNFKPFEPHSSLTTGELAPLLIAYATATVADTHARLRAATLGTTSIIVGYPLVLSGNECTALQLPPFGESSVKVTASEQGFLREMITLMNSAIEVSAALNGLHYIPMADRFAGHEVCGNLDDWINGVVIFNPTFNFKATAHPTARGHREYANAINEFLNAKAQGWVHGYNRSGLPRNPPPLQRVGTERRATVARGSIPEMGDLRISLVTGLVECDRLQGVIVPGESARLEGDGYAPHESVAVSLIIDGRKQLIGNFAADASGKLSVLVTIPIEVQVDSVIGVEALGAGPSGIGRLLLSMAGVQSSSSVDTDGDGVPDLCDNCSLKANADQRDTDRDGYGDVCDADFDNDGVVSTLDLALLRSMTGRTGDGLLADLNGDFTVDSADLDLFRSLFGKPPGPAFKVQPGARPRAASARKDAR